MASRLLLLLALLTARPLPAQTAVDTSGVATLITQAMDHSEVKANLQHLPDVIGPPAAVMAVTAYELANLPELLSRGPRSAPERVPNRPSQRVTTR